MYILGVWNFVLPVFNAEADTLTALANGILWIGVAINFAALAESDSSGKFALQMQRNQSFYLFWIGSLLFGILIIFGMALIGMITTGSELRDLWVSLLVLGIGMIGILKMSLDLKASPKQNSTG